MSTVTLKDGSQVAEAVYASITMILRTVKEENPVAFSDLFRKCKYADTTFTTNRNYEDSKTILTRYALIGEDQEVHADVRKVVLNSIEGSGLNLKLVSPLKPEQVQKIQ
jgi:hypothetical protein